jgi:hypothetical protein
MNIEYDDRDDIFTPRKQFAIDVVHGPMLGRGVVLHVRDQTYQFAQPHLTPTEARQLAADLTRLADACEGKL